jgi:hypothetical protein
MDTMYVTIGVLGYVALAFCFYLVKREEERTKRESVRLRLEAESLVKKLGLPITNCDPISNNGSPYFSPEKVARLRAYLGLVESPSEAIKISVELLKAERKSATSPVVQQSIERLLTILEKEI